MSWAFASHAGAEKLALKEGKIAELEARTQSSCDTQQEAQVVESPETSLSTVHLFGLLDNVFFGPPQLFLDLTFLASVGSYYLAVPLRCSPP